jgi:hypothetical protein
MHSSRNNAIVRLFHKSVELDRDEELMHGLPAIVVVVVVVAFVISALIVGVVHVVAESVGIIAPALNLANALSSESCNVLRHILDIIDGIVPLVLHTVLGIVVVVLNVLRDVFDLSDLCSKLVCD